MTEAPTPNTESTSAPVVQWQDRLTPSAERRFDSDPGAPPLSPKAIRLAPIPFAIGRQLLVRHHYLRSASGATLVMMGAFVGVRLLGVLQISRGSLHAHRLVEGASPTDVGTLARLWLSDELPTNGESRVLGVACRLLRKHTPLRFLVSYADPAAGHRGGIYQAAGWLYTGRSEAMPRLDLGDGVARHSRSIGHALGTYSIPYLQEHGFSVRQVPEAAKHRYLTFLDAGWRDRLAVPVLPYPRLETT